MQGLFGLFGKKHPEPSAVAPANLRNNRKRSQSKVDEDPALDDRSSGWDDLRQSEFPIESRFDPDEETNWDDAEIVTDEKNLIGYAQPIAPVAVLPLPTAPDLDDWHEALPAATVKNSNIQEARRGKNSTPISLNEDVWDDDLDSNRSIGDRSTFLPNSSPNFNPAPPSQSGRSLPSQRYASGFWAVALHQFRRILPIPIRQLSDTILTAMLTAILVAIVTVGIWFVDGFFVPGREPSVASPPAAPIATQPYSSPTTAAPQVNPEQALIEAIQTQLSEVTSEYPDDTIQTLSVDIARNRLVVRLNPIWDRFADDLQNSIVNLMWLKAQANHFSKLEIQDSQGVSIARSPVVGKQMIMLQRRQNDLMINS
jgi:hypothetical protein